MKKYFNLSYLLLTFIFISCGPNLEINEQTYVPPSLKSKPRLLYPKAALENSYTGTSKISVLISKTGKVDKTHLINSSGFEMMDKAAVDYCNGLVYEPAKRNGEPVNSRMEIEIKFDLAEIVWSAADYVSAVKELYAELWIASPSSRNKIEKEILNWHNEFVQNMNDVLKFNLYIEQVIKPGLSAEWKNIWNSWPLSFLLYHDFIERFADYNDLANVKESFKNSLEEDIYYMKNSPVYNIDEEKERENLIVKIKEFVAKNYPDILLDGVQSDARINLQYGTMKNY